jgi:hypothetical protein
MPLYSVSALKALAEGLLGGLTIELMEGDYCAATCLSISHPTFGEEDAVHLTGFDEEELSAGDEVELDKIELLSLNSDSSGGVKQSNMELQVFAAKLTSSLQSQGFTVVDTLSGYF